MKRLLSFSLLGQWGRFGNQLFEYAFTRILASKSPEECGAAFPHWIGRDLFRLDPADYTVSDRPRPRYTEQTYHLKESAILNEIDRNGWRNIPAVLDLAGVFQYHTSFYRPYQDKIRQWFSPQGWLYVALSCALFDCIGTRPLVAIHLRRGDYLTCGPQGGGCFFVPPNEWYKQWLAAVWDILRVEHGTEPVLYIASDAENIDELCADFAEYSPIHAGKIGYTVPGAPFFVDFWTLTQAKYLAISNSTFSFAASMLNEDAETFLRPQLCTLPGMPQGLLHYNPWDAEPLLNRELGLGHLEMRHSPFALGAA